MFQKLIWKILVYLLVGHRSYWVIPTYVSIRVMFCYCHVEVILKKFPWKTSVDLRWAGEEKPQTHRDFDSFVLKPLRRRLNSKRWWGSAGKMTMIYVLWSRLRQNGILTSTFFRTTFTNHFFKKNLSLNLSKVNVECLILKTMILN